jgi:hypothetical protein
MSYHINHNPFIRKRIISFDSRFRDEVYSTPCDYVYKLQFPIRNIISVRLSSIEYPNTYFVFSACKGNTILFIGFRNAGSILWIKVEIPDGNYTTLMDDPTSLQTVVRNAIKAACLPYVMNGTILDPDIQVQLNPSTGYVTIKSATGVEFVLNFKGGIFDMRTYDWGLGYNLGFREKEYLTFATSFSGTMIIDVIGAAYIFFQLNEIDSIQHYTPEKNVISAFAKLLMVGEKNAIIYDDGSTYVTKEYKFSQPIDFFQIHPRLVDTYGHLVDLNGKNYSFTLELEEITNVTAYKQYRDNYLKMSTEWNATYSV